MRTGIGRSPLYGLSPSSGSTVVDRSGMVGSGGEGREAVDQWYGCPYVGLAEVVMISVVPWSGAAVFLVGLCVCHHVVIVHPRPSRRADYEYSIGLSAVAGCRHLLLPWFSFSLEELAVFDDPQERGRCLYPLWLRLCGLVFLCPIVVALWLSRSGYNEVALPSPGAIGGSGHMLLGSDSTGGDCLVWYSG